LFAKTLGIGSNCPLKSFFFILFVFISFLRVANDRITFYPRHKAVVRDWYGNGLLTPLSGKIEFIQETEHSASSIQAELKGLGGAIGRYGLFAAPVRADLLFPCTEQVQ